MNTPEMQFQATNDLLQLHCKFHIFVRNFVEENHEIIHNQQKKQAILLLTDQVLHLHCYSL